MLTCPSAVMQPLSLLDACAALLATVVVAQSLTLGAIQAIRIRESARQESRLRGDAYRRGMPWSGSPPGAAVWLLMALILAAAVALGDVVQHLGLSLLSHWLSPVHTAALLMLGPALWFYALSVTQSPHETLPTWKRFALHSAPAALLALTMAVQVMRNPWAIEIESEVRSWSEVLVLIPIAAQILAYLGAVVWRVSRQRRLLEAQFSRLEHRKLHWLQAAAVVFALLVVVWVVTWTLPVSVSNILTNGLLALDVALLGVFGARQQNVFAARPWIDPASATPTSFKSADEASDRSLSPELASDDASGNAAATLAYVTPQEVTRPEPVGQGSKYAKSALPASIAAEMAERLERCVTVDKPYLECDLTLGELAEAIGVTSHQLSQVLSTQLGLSFFEYVNGLRVEAVKATLSRPQSAGRPLLEIALECGFGSKSAFNEAFRRATGMSPSEYRRALPASAAPTVPVERGNAAETSPSGQLQSVRS